MRNYSDKQLKLAKQLCYEFGFEDRKFINDFLDYYASCYGSYQKGKEKWFYSYSNAIDALLTEKKIRNTRSLLKSKESNFKHLRATDLANYTFCQVSFSISNTFEIEYPSNEKKKLEGEKLHNQLKLINRIKKSKLSRNKEWELEEPIIIKILKSEIIYIGHDNEDNKSFFDSELKIASEPDYIFKDLYSKYFVVEEKFMFKTDPRKPTFEDNKLKWDNIYSEKHVKQRNKEIADWDNFKPSFFQNHQIQLITYLKCIKEYELKYGYLVYWYYDFKKDTPYVHKVCVEKFTVNESTLNMFNRTLSNIKTLMNEKKDDFDFFNVSPKKCGGCVVNKYCGHKNKKYKELSFPYKRDYLKLF